MYCLFDVEEDEELEMCSETGSSISATNISGTCTNSAVINPDGLSRITSSYDFYPFIVTLSWLNANILFVIRWQDAHVIGRARLGDDYPVLTADQQESPLYRGKESENWMLSGLSTPNNSPDGSSPGTPPLFYSPLELLSQGAEIIRRKWTGEETPVHQFHHPVPRIPRKELEVMSRVRSHVLNV